MSISVGTTTAIAMIAIGSLLAWDRTHPRLQEQTALLERVAARVERAMLITPETYDVLAGVLDRARNGPVRDGSRVQLEERRHAAILRLEKTLLEKAATRRQVIAGTSS